MEGQKTVSIPFSEVSRGSNSDLLEKGKESGQEGGIVRQKDTG